MPEPALQKVLRAKMSDRDIVRPNFRYSWKNGRVIQVHEGNLQFLTRFHQDRRTVTRDHAMPFFAEEKSGVFLRTGVVVEKSRPLPMRTLVINDSLQHSPRFLEAH